jgi:hypothetical protein
MALTIAIINYFSLVFGAGFALGVLRVLFLAPWLGNRFAELLELSVMLLVIVLSARWIVCRFGGNLGPRAMLWIGLTAFGLMLVAELAVGIGLRGMSLSAALLNKDPVSGSAYYASLLVFTVLPWALRRQWLATMPHNAR